MSIEERISRRVLRRSNGIKLFLQTQFLELVERQAHKNIDAIGEHSQRIGKGEANFCFITGCSSGIRYAPMGGHWLARPDRAHFACGVVANGKNKIERRCSGL